jgi:hypothetical protein
MSGGSYFPTLSSYSLLFLPTMDWRIELKFPAKIEMEENN